MEKIETPLQIWWKKIETPLQIWWKKN